MGIFTKKDKFMTQTPNTRGGPSGPATPQQLQQVGAASPACMLQTLLHKMTTVHRDAKPATGRAAEYSQCAVSSRGMKARCNPISSSTG
jgi:hypothetical protein